MKTRTKMIARGKLDYKVGIETDDEIGELSRTFDQMPRSLSTSLTPIDNLNQEIAELKLAEKTLRESEEKFSKAFHATPDLISIGTLKDGRIIEVNDSFTQISGYSREDVIGHSVAELNIWVNPADRDRITQALERKGRVRNIELEFRKKSGATHWVLFSAELVNIGDEPCIIAVSTDITRRKQAEMGLVSTQEKLKEAHRLAHIGTWDLVFESDTITWSEEMYSIAGMDPAVTIPASAESTRLYTPESWNKLNQAIEKAVATGEPYNLELQIIRPDGSTRWVNEFGGVMRDGNGKVFGLHGTLQDITRRKQAEEELFIKNALLEAQIETTLDGIMVIDKNGNIILVNRQFQEIFHMPGELLEAKDDTRVFEHVISMVEDARTFTQKMDYLYEHKEAKSRDEIQLKDGRVFDRYSSPLIDANDNHHGRIWFIRDITERKQAEEKQQAIIKTALDGFWISNLEGRLLEVNDSYCKMTGYTHEELLEMSIQDIEASENPGQTARHIKKIVKHGSDRFETQHRRKNGNIIDIDISVNYLNIGEGQLFVFVRDITERKRAEEALLIKNALLEAQIETTIDGILVVDENNQIILCNKRFQEIHHMPQELRGVKDDKRMFQHILSLVKDAGPFQKRIEHLNTHQDERGHDEIELKDGRVCERYSSPLIDANGIYRGRIWFIRDITERKRAEEELRLLSSVTQQVSDSTIVTDPDFKITYMNQAAQDLFGYTIEDVRGKGLEFFHDKPFPKKRMQEVLQVLSSGKVWSNIATKRRKDGSTFICDCRLSPLFGEEGQICSYIYVGRDITNQKEVEEKLQAQKQLVERILATMPEGVLVIASDDRIILANETFHKIFHTGKKPIVNKLLDEIIPVDQLFNLYEAVRQGETEKNTLEFRYQVKDHEKIIVCVINKMGGERTLLTFIDVSQEREEEEKLYLTDRLASIGEMAAGLAHELNNPLTGILALSQLLIDSGIPEEHREDLQCVYSEAKRAASIVKNVLLFTRNNNYENGQASANEVIRDILRLREYEEKVSNITAATNLQENLPDILIDKFQLQQVFLNIILNAEAAIKETNRPGTLLVTTERVNNHINIHFKDDGCGIKKHVLPRIFDPFFTTKDIGKGTGLGLSICYGIIVKHGGRISVKTQVNKGTTFTIRMPIAPQTV